MLPTSFQHPGAGHGLGTTSVAIADDDNGTDNTMVGTAPNIRGVQLLDDSYDSQKNAATPMPQLYDLDLTDNGIIKMPDVVSNSGNANYVRREIVDHGMVYVRCVGNANNRMAVQVPDENGHQVVEIQPYRRSSPDIPWSWSNDPTMGVYPDSTGFPNRRDISTEMY
jgi:hypothetical protein